MSRVSKKRGYSAKGLASTDSPGMSRVSGESVDTLPRVYYIGWHPRIVRGCPEYPRNVDTLSRGYYIGWHPRIVRGCPEYPGNPWILFQGGIVWVGIHG